MLLNLLCQCIVFSQKLFWKYPWIHFFFFAVTFFSFSTVSSASKNNRTTLSLETDLYNCIAVHYPQQHEFHIEISAS